MQNGEMVAYHPSRAVLSQRKTLLPNQLLCRSMRDQRRPLSISPPQSPSIGAERVWIADTEVLNITTKVIAMRWTFYTRTSEDPSSAVFRCIPVPLSCQLTPLHGRTKISNHLLSISQ